MHVPLKKNINSYVSLPLLALWVLKYKRHAVMKVHVSTKTHSELKCHVCVCVCVCVHLVFLIILAEQNSRCEFFLFLIFLSLL